MIYFIRCNEFVKIGRGAMPEERMNTLQTGNPYKIELLGAFDGLDAEERRIHDAFVQFHHHGEWYYLSETIKIFVAKHCVRKNVLRLVPKAAKAQAGKPGKRQSSSQPDFREVGSVDAWWGDDIVERRDAESRAGLCYEAYKTWCETRDMRPLSPKNFGEAIKSKLGRECVETRRKYTFYKGIILADAA